MSLPRSDFILLEEEVIQVVNGAPALVRYFPGDISKPLIVCIPGGGHTARIYYGGHPAGRQEDFLVFWIQNGTVGNRCVNGNSVLALSYPAETSDGHTMLPATPGYTVRDWGQQTATIAAGHIQRHSLPKQLVLVVWSMGGRILESFCASATLLGVQVKLAVSLAATPGIFGLRPRASGVQMSPAGYARREGTSKFFFQQLEIQSMLNVGNSQETEPRHIIDFPDLESYYMTSTPVHLLGWGFRYENTRKAGDEGAHSPSESLSKFEQGDASDWADIQDARVHNWSALPLTAVIQPTHVQDFSHALGDKASWGLVNAFRLISDFTKLLSSGVAVDQIRFQKFRELADSIPSRLSRQVEGNHYFFVGKKGARETAKVIAELIAVVDEVQEELDVQLQ